MHVVRHTQKPKIYSVILNKFGQSHSGIPKVYAKLQNYESAQPQE